MLTPWQKQKGRRARAEGKTWTQAALAAKTSYHHIRKELDPEWWRERMRVVREATKRREASYGREYFPPTGHAVRHEIRNPRYDPNRDGPPHYASITAQIFGDPPIGRSALDRRMGRG